MRAARQGGKEIYSSAQAAASACPQDTATIVRNNMLLTQWAALTARLGLVLFDSQQLFPIPSSPLAAQSAGS